MTYKELVETIFSDEYLRRITEETGEKESAIIIQFSDYYNGR